MVTQIVVQLYYAWEPRNKTAGTKYAPDKAFLLVVLLQASQKFDDSGGASVMSYYGLLEMGLN